MSAIATPSMLRLVAFLKRQARRGTWQGDGLTPYFLACQADHESGSRVIYTRDVGHHTSGWLKNPDYERCLHLSLSFRDPATGRTRPYDKPLAELWVDLFFGEWKRLLWEEGPKSIEGMVRGVRHWRLFCDAAWQPILPRGEVYSTQFTELGWKSWSELHPGDEAMSAVMRRAQ